MSIITRSVIYSHRFIDQWLVENVDSNDKIGRFKVKRYPKFIKMYINKSNNENNLNIILCNFKSSISSTTRNRQASKDYENNNQHK